MDTKQNEKVAKALKELFMEHGTVVDVGIYFNGKVYKWEKGIQGEEPMEFDGVQASKVSRWADDESVFVSFDGGSGLFESLNYYPTSMVVQDLERLLEGYGLYYELGEAWNFTVMEK